MRTSRIASTLFTLAAICAGNAFAQSADIKPGLWQIDVAMPGQAGGNRMAGMMAQMKAQMASMPPEQRKQIEKAMAELDSRGTEFTDQGVRLKECISKDDIARFDLLGKKAPESCTRTSSPMAGGVNVSMSCTRPQMKIDAAIKFQGDKAYTFESLATLPGPDGKPTTQKTSGSGKWLGGDCGKIKSASNGK